MSIAIIFNNKEAESWASAIMNDYSQEVEIYPNIKDKNAVDFLLVWRPHDNYLNEFPNVKVVHSIGAGVDHMLNTKINENVSFARIVDQDLKHDMFEHVLGLILLENKNFVEYLDNQKSSIWKPKSYKSAKNTNITILGVGEIGDYVANRLVDLGYNVSSWSKNSKKNKKYTHFFGNENIDKAIKDANFIINILPLTAETTGILNLYFFKKLKNKPLIINVGRGKHIVETDLIEALNENYISKAFIDVFAIEPLPDNHKYWNNPKIFITPHIASVTQPETCVKQIIENYDRMKSGKTILNTISLEKQY